MGKPLKINYGRKIVEFKSAHIDGMGEETEPPMATITQHLEMTIPKPGDPLPFYCGQISMKGLTFDFEYSSSGYFFVRPSSESWSDNCGEGEMDEIELEGIRKFIAHMYDLPLQLVVRSSVG